MCTGCERTKASTVTGQQLTEATFINKSLSALGDVIAALCGKGTAASTLGLAPTADSPQKPSAPPKFIPYRNSKLTLLLQDALQPNGKAKVICCRTPSCWPTSPDSTSFTLTNSSRPLPKLVRV
jgi:hypothetical protein